MAVNYGELQERRKSLAQTGFPTGVGLGITTPRRRKTDLVPCTTALPRYWAIAIAKGPLKEPFLKRPLDIFLSSLMILLSLPASFLIILAIKLEDRGPIFYRQERWGWDCTSFKALKFRTMVPNSDKAFGIRPAEENDCRVTKVGKLLRSMGLDELPQIVNIFRGQMSFVGPRSLAVGEIIKAKSGRMTDYREVPGFRKRLHARPGLTSIATIYIPKDSTPYRKFRYDLLYIRKQSFWLDVRLILLSFWISFRGKWETRERKM